MTETDRQLQIALAIVCQAARKFCPKSNSVCSMEL